MEFHIVAKDCAGVVPQGTALPPLVEVRDPYRIGGRWDTLTRKFVGPCHKWQVWLIGEKQFQILLNPKTRHTLLFAAEGSGKTTLMGMIGWKIVIMAAVAGLSGCLGATAPTSNRMVSLLEAMTSLAPVSTQQNQVAGAWGFLRQDAGDIKTCSGHLIRFRSTKRASKAQGSPLQSYNFGLGVLMDEIQDSLDAVDDALARLRSAPGAPIVGTCTAKDSPDFRTFRDSLHPDDWTVERIDYRDAFAVHDSHWTMLKRNLSEREWQRRALAMDVGPELMTYVSWSRAENLRAVPQIGVKDVTKSVLSRYGPNYTVLVGHDPGQICDVSLILRAYQIGNDPEPYWWVVDEITTKRTTTEEHLTALMATLRGKYGTNQVDYRGRPMADSPRAHVRIDPYGDSDTRTDRSVYESFRHAGLDARSAAYKQGKGSGRVPKEAGIEMICRLLCNANGKRRLFIDMDEHGRPVAPNLVNAIEMSERDSDGKAETQRKGTADLSHWMAALRYALYQLERHPTTRAEIEEGHA